MNRIWLHLACLTCLSASFLHSPVALSAEALATPEMFPLELTPKDEFPNGNATYLQATADAEGIRYQLEGTELDQPILVSVLTRDAADNVRVRIVKDDWSKPERDAVTAGNDRLDFGFRTFDGFKLWITADKPTEYQLIVWAGDPVEAEIPPIAVPASQFVDGAASKSGGPADSGRSYSPLELGLAGALLLMLGGLVAFMFSRRTVKPGVSP